MIANNKLKLPQHSVKLRRIFVWELPVRIFHWTNVWSLFALCITGYLIGNPPAILSNEEASFRHVFGIIRLIHFIAAYIFLFNYLFRLYWAFVGNKYATWQAFVPTRRGFLKRLWSVLIIDVLLAKEKEHIAVGHNALAGATYFFVFLLAIVQVFTGFGLYAAMSDFWIAELFAWVPGVFGGDFFIRMIHHSSMWLFIIFSIIHMYLVFYHDYVEGRGEVSSMTGGWKFMEEDLLDEEPVLEESDQ